MLFKQKSEIKHMHTMGVVVVKICVYLLDVSMPRQHNKGHIEPVNEPNPPKTKSTPASNSQLPFLSQCKGRNGHRLILRLTFATIMWQGLGSNSCSLICSQTRCRLRYHVLLVHGN